jgi:hypothetical protein
VQALVTIEAENGSFLTCIPRTGRIGGVTLVLVAVMELGLSITYLKPAEQVTPGAACQLVFSLLGLGLGEWV